MNRTKTNSVAPLGLTMHEIEKIDAEGIAREKAEAKTRALDSLARGGYMMFGYFASIWTTLNRVDGRREPNPFKALVHGARKLGGDANRGRNGG